MPEPGHDLLELANYTTSSAEGLQRMQELAGLDAEEKLIVMENDARFLYIFNSLLGAALSIQQVEIVIYFFGFNSAGESVQ